MRLGRVLPAAVGGGARRARVQDMPDRHAVGEHGAGPAFAPPADADDQARLEIVDDLQQRAVADPVERPPLVRRQLVRRSIAARCLQEGQRAIVPHEEPAEEGLGRAETVPRPAPQAAAADLAAGAREALDRPFRMLARRRFHAGPDAEPGAHQRDLPERHSRLHHAERSRVHAEQQHFRFGPAMPLQVLAMRRGGVLEGVVDVLDGRREREGADVPREGAGDGGRPGHGCAEKSPDRDPHHVAVLVDEDERLRAFPRDGLELFRDVRVKVELPRPAGEPVPARGRAVEDPQRDVGGHGEPGAVRGKVRSGCQGDVFVSPDQRQHVVPVEVVGVEAIQLRPRFPLQRLAGLAVLGDEVELAAVDEDGLAVEVPGLRRESAPGPDSGSAGRRARASSRPRAGPARGRRTRRGPAASCRCCRRRRCTASRPRGRCPPSRSARRCRWRARASPRALPPRRAA